MGMIRDTKVQMVTKAARRASDEGRTVFAARLSTAFRLGDGTGPVGDWSEIIDAVEAEGWTLAQWAVCETRRGPAAYPLFRRSGVAGTGEH